MHRIKGFVFHPFLMAVYPILALLAHNIDQLKPASAYRSLLISIGFIGLLFLIYKAILRDWHRAGILSALTTLLFFSYGHFYQFIRQEILFGSSLGRHRILLPVWFFLFVLGVWLAAKRIRNPHAITRALNIILGILIIFPVFNLIDSGIRSSKAWSELEPSIDLQTFQPPQNELIPDIYYIILDGYGREDILAEYYAFDNSPFITWLSDHGFHVASMSQSNYAQTELSLASSLNMDYLQTLRPDFVSGSDDRSMLRPMIQKSTLRLILEQLGFKIVSFESGYSWTQIEDADYYLTRRTGSIGESYALGQMNGFEAMLLQNSALLIVTDAVIVLPDMLNPDTKAPFLDHQERILYVLETLKLVPTMQSPKFVFAHLVVPHPPFVFALNQEDVVLAERFTLAETDELEDDASYIDGYINQVEFINSQMELVLSEILLNSENPPIIILQADHGPGHFTAQGRMAILNAFYLPGAEDTLIPESISPVNSFRIILNKYFEGQFAILDNIAYYSTYQEPYNFKIVED